MTRIVRRVLGVYLSDHASTAQTEARSSRLFNCPAGIAHTQTTLLLVLMRVRGGSRVRVVRSDSCHCLSVDNGLTLGKREENGSTDDGERATEVNLAMKI